MIRFAPHSVWAETQQIRDGVITVRLDQHSGRFSFFSVEALRRRVERIEVVTPRADAH